MLFFLGIVGLCLATLTVGQDRFDRLSSGVLFDGINAADPNADGTSVFKDFCNHADAVASILLYHAKDAGFDPSTNRVSTPPEAYFGFLQNVADFPAFYSSLGSNAKGANIKDQQYALELNGDLEQLLELIAQKFRMHSKTKADRIKAAFRALVPTEVGDDNDSVKNRVRKNIRQSEMVRKKRKKEQAKNNWLLGLVTLHMDQDSNEVWFEMTHVRLTMSRDKDSGAMAIDRQTGSMVISSYGVMGRYISFYAEEIAKFIDKGSVDQLIRTLSTSTSTSTSTIRTRQSGTEGSQASFHLP